MDNCTLLHYRPTYHQARACPVSAHLAPIPAISHIANPYVRYPLPRNSVHIAPGLIQCHLAMNLPQGGGETRWRLLLMSLEYVKKTLRLLRIMLDMAERPALLSISEATNENEHDTLPFPD